MEQPQARDLILRPQSIQFDLLRTGELATHAVTLPLYPTMGKERVKFVVKAGKKMVKVFCSAK